MLDRPFYFALSPFLSQTVARDLALENSNFFQIFHFDCLIWLFPGHCSYLIGLNTLFMPKNAP